MKRSLDGNRRGCSYWTERRMINERTESHLHEIRNLFNNTSPDVECNKVSVSCSSKCATSSEEATFKQDISEMSVQESAHFEELVHEPTSNDCEENLSYSPSPAEYSIINPRVSAFE